MLKKGFTLLELLIALSIFTLISLITTTALHTILNTQSHLNQKTKRLSEVQWSLTLLSRDIEQAIDRPITNAVGEIENSFIGTPTGITFTHAGLTNTNGTLTRSTLERTTYEVKQNIFLRTTWDVLDQKSTSTSHSKRLLHHISQIEWSYLDSHGHFQNRWPPSNQADNPLPCGIQITLTLKNWGKITQLYLTGT